MPLMRSSFSKLKINEKTIYALNNGWVMGIDPR